MPTGKEETLALLIKAAREDAGLQGIFASSGTGQGGEQGSVKVYRDEVPPTVTVPFLFLAEGTDSENLRDSETIEGAGKYAEMLYVHAVAFATDGDTAKAIIRRLRHLLIPRSGEARSPYLAADPTNDPENVYDVTASSMKRQNLLPTETKNEDGQDIFQSTETYSIVTLKNDRA